MSESMGTAVLTLRADDSQLNSDLSKAGSAITAWAARINASFSAITVTSADVAFKSLTTTLKDASGAVQRLTVENAANAAEMSALRQETQLLKMIQFDAAAATEKLRAAQAASVAEKTRLTTATQELKMALAEEMSAAKLATEAERGSAVAENAANKRQLASAAQDVVLRLKEEATAAKLATEAERSTQIAETAAYKRQLATATLEVTTRLKEEAQAAKQAAQEEKAAQSANLAQEKLRLAAAVAETKMRLMEEAQAAHSAAGGFNALHTAMQPVSGGFTILKGAIASTIGNLASNAIQAVTSGIFDLGRGIVNMGISAIKANGDLEQSQVAFKVLTGSAADANAEIKVLQQYADHTSFTFIGVKQAAIDLQTAGFNAKEAEVEMTRLGDAVAGMGGGDVQLEQIAEDVAQVAVKGHLAGQEVLQFANAGIPMIQILADKFHITKDEADKMVTAGLIPASVAIQALNEYVGTKFANAAELQSHTFNGMISTLQDWFNRALQIVGQPLFEKLKPKLEEFLNFLSQPSTLAALAKFGEDLGTVIGNAIDWITNTAIPTLVQAWPQITAIIGDVASIIGSAASTFATIASYAVSWGAGIIDALAQGIYAGAEAVIEAVNFIASIITSLLETHSPPKVLPKLPDWGKGAIQSWIDGWKQGDFSVFDGIADTVKSYLTGLSDLGRFGKGGIVPAVFGTEEAMTKLLTQLQETGTVSQASLDAVTQAAGPAGDLIRGLVEAEVNAAQASHDLESAHADVAAATQRVSDAQDNLNAVTQEYTDKLQPLNDQLAQLSEQEQNITRAQEERKLGLDTSPQMVALKAQSAALELQQKQNELASINVDTAAKAAELHKTIDSSKTSQAAKDKAAQDLAQLNADAQKKSVDLQIQILTLQAQQGDTSQNQLDTLKLQGDQLTDQKTTLDDQKTAAEKIAQAQLDAATKEADAAKKRETQAQAVVDAANKQVTAQKNIVTEMEKQNALLHEQEQTIASLTGGGAGGAGGKGGGGKGGGIGGGVGGALGAAVANAGKGGLLGDLKTQLADAGKNVDDAKKKIGDLFNISGFTDFKNNLDGIAKGFKDFGKELDGFSKSAQPVIQNLLDLTKATINGVLRPPGGPSTGNNVADILTGQGNGPDIKMPWQQDKPAAGTNGQWWTPDGPLASLITAVTNTANADNARSEKMSPTLDQKYGYQYANDATSRSYAGSHETDAAGGAYIPPDAADYVLSAEDAIAKKKKQYQSVAAWAAGPEAKLLARESWAYLFAIAPDDAAGFIKKAQGYAETIMGGVHFSAADAKGSGLLADRWSVELDSGKLAIEQGMTKMGDTYRTKLAAINQDGKIGTREVHTTWSQSFDKMEQSTSDSMAKSETAFATKLTGMFGNLNTWGPQIVGKATSIWNDLTGVTQKKSDEMATKHRDALVKLNTDSSDTYAAITSTVKKGMDDEAAAANAGMGTINTNAQTQFGTYSGIVQAGLDAAHTKFTLEMGLLNDDGKTKLATFSKQWEDNFSGLPVMTQKEMDKVGAQQNAHLAALKSDTDINMKLINKDWEDDWASFPDAVTAQQKPVSDAAKGIADGALAALNAVDTSVPGANLVLGYIRGINSQAGAASAAARQLANTTNQAFQGAQKISSPSKVWEEFGHYTIDGLILGIANRIPNAVSMIGNVTSQMTLAAHKGADDIGGALDAIPAKLADFGKSIHESDPAYKGWFGGIGITDPKSILFGGRNTANTSGIDATAALGSAAPSSDGSLASVASSLTDWAATTTTTMTTAGQGIGQALLAGIAAGLQMGQDALRKALAGVTALLPGNGTWNAGRNVGNMNGLLPDFGSTSRQMVGNMMNTPYPLNLPEYHMTGGQTATKAGNTYTMHTTINNPQQPMAELQRDFQRFQFLREGGD